MIAMMPNDHTRVDPAKLSNQFKTDKLLPLIEQPIFLFHGTEDENVPYVSSERLSRLGSNILLFTIEDGSHNNLNTFEDYHNWMDEALS